MSAADPPEGRPYAERDLERETFWLHLTEEQASAMAGGYVPNGVKGVLRELLDYDLEDLKRSERPVTKNGKVGRVVSRPVANRRLRGNAHAGSSPAPSATKGDI